MSKEKDLLDMFDDFEEKTKEIIVKTEEIQDKILKTEVKKEEKPKIVKPKAKQTSLIDKPKRKSYSAKKEIDIIKSEMKRLRDLIIESKNEIIITEKPVIDGIIKHLSEYNFTIFKENLMREHNLKQYDKIVIFPDGKKNRLLWNWKYFLKTYPEIYENQDRYNAAKFINRILRTGEPNFIYLVDTMKQNITDIINKYSKIE